MKERELSKVVAALKEHGFEGEIKITSMKETKREAASKFKLGTRNNGEFIPHCPKVSEYVLCQILNEFTHTSNLYATNGRETIVFEKDPSGKPVISSMQYKKFGIFSQLAYWVKVLFA